jgi:hypothetical protein
MRISCMSINFNKLYFDLPEHIFSCPGLVAVGYNVTVFALYSGDVLLKYRNVLEIDEHVNEMMGSSSHQPPKGKFDDTKGVIRSRISKK